jgi:orotidine-5'-phosphate decarboxylase
VLISPADTAADRLIVALDVPTRDAALSMVDELEEVRFYKIGLQLFIAEGMALVREIASRGKRIFLDLKIDDIDETIRLAVAEVAQAPVDLLTIQGHRATARAAASGKGSSTRLRVLQVTLLSSMGEDDLRALGLVGEVARFPTITDYIRWRATEAVGAGCDGLIASGDSISQVRAAVGDRAIIVSPGIRPAGTQTNEHKRPTTPRAAIAAGADYLVVGRHIRDAKDRRGEARRVIDEIGLGP